MKKKIISLFICAIMIITTVAGMTITSSAMSTYHSDTGWYICNGLYGFDENGDGNLSAFSRIDNIAVNYPHDFINAFVNNGILTSSTTFVPNNYLSVTDRWYPVQTVSPGSDLGFINGNTSTIKLKLGATMEFGDTYGYNGMVSFAWYNSPDAYDFAKDSYSATPANLHYSNYDPLRVIYFDYFYNMSGGLGPQLANSGVASGVTLTLYPDNSGVFQSRTVTHFRIFMKKNTSLTNSQLFSDYDSDYEIYEGDLPNGGLSFANMRWVRLERNAVNNSLQFKVSEDGTTWSTLSGKKIMRVENENSTPANPSFTVYDSAESYDTFYVDENDSLDSIMSGYCKMAICAMGAHYSDASVIINTIN